MKKSFPLLLLMFMISFTTYSQTIEGDQLLNFLNKPVSDPDFQKLKTQDGFYTDAWDKELSLYIRIKDNTILEVEAENGRLRTDGVSRYGYYKRKLPLGLNWNMTAADFAKRFGPYVASSAKLNYEDYSYNNYNIRVFYENGKPTSIAYSRPGSDAAINSTPVPAANTPLVKMVSSGDADVSWPVLKYIMMSFGNFKKLANNDSVDYIGQTYYGTNFKAQGFDRTALKRYKSKGQWWYEAFYKTSADSNEVKRIFGSLYRGFKKVIETNTNDDFIFASVMDDPLGGAEGKSSMNWLLQWSLYTKYRYLPPGLGKIKICLLLTGMKNSFKNNQMEYTMKIYVTNKDVDYDFFTWDTPK